MYYVWEYIWNYLASEDIRCRIVKFDVKVI